MRTPELDDYLAHLQALIECEHKIMDRGLIFPAVRFIQEAQLATHLAIAETCTSIVLGKDPAYNGVCKTHELLMKRGVNRG